jgi:5-methylcytosine-specific restriction endonuclease McrA
MAVARVDPLASSVLVLNRQYMAVQVVNMRRALRLLYCQTAEVIHDESGRFANYDFDSWREMSQLVSEMRVIAEEDDEVDDYEEWIRAVNFDLRAPRVIRLLSFDKTPRKRVQLNRRAVLARDEYHCQYCGKRFPIPQLSLDHVVPRSRGGKTTWENIVCACVKCNVKKGSRTPEEASMKLIRKPVRPGTSPLLRMKLENPKYKSWLMWLGPAKWEISVASG